MILDSVAFKKTVRNQHLRRNLKIKQKILLNKIKQHQRPRISQFLTNPLCKGL